MNDPYVYPGTTVLKNIPGIRSPEALDRFERLAVAARIRQGVPEGPFDLQHLQSIHRHLFQDVYGWAGEIRTVQISKGESSFLPVRFIEQGMADVHSRLTARKFLREMGRGTFIAEAATIIGDVNHIHPFREGNGRTQLQYLQQLARQAGHPMDVRRIEPERWLNASIAANRGDCSQMSYVLHKSVRATERIREARQLRDQELSRNPG